MAIDPTIRQFQASGVYRLLIDNSRIPAQPVDEALRLVIGFSKNGPFNTVVFVPDTEFFTAVYGERDRTLERQGSWFHLTSLISLLDGPIFCLNLLNLDDELDKVEYKGFSLTPSVLNDPKIEDSYSGFYNTDKFYYPDQKEFLNITKENSVTPKLFNLVNLNKTPITVIVKKSNVTGFNITAKEWYGTELDELPTFLNPNDYISDYMVDVVILKGDYTDFNSLKNDILFGEFFDDKGLIKDSLEEFLLVPEVVTLDRYQGSLIPDFIDKLGNPLFIETLINRDSSRTGLFCAIDQEAFDNNYLSGTVIDLVGHSVEKNEPANIEFLSYKDTLKEEISELAKNNPVTENLVAEAYSQAERSIRTTIKAFDIANNPSEFALITPTNNGDIVISVESTPNQITANVWDNGTLNYVSIFNLNEGDTIFVENTNSYYIVVLDNSGNLVIEDSNISNSIVIADDFDEQGNPIVNGLIKVGKNNPLSQQINEFVTWYFRRTPDDKFVQPISLDRITDPDYNLVKFNHSLSLTEENVLFIQEGINYLELFDPVNILEKSYYHIGEGHPLYLLWAEGIITSGDTFSNGNFVKFEEELESGYIKIDNSFGKRLKVTAWAEESFTTQEDVPTFSVVTDSNGVQGNGLTITSINGDLNLTLDVIGYLDLTDKTRVIVDNTNGSFAGKLNVGGFLVSDLGEEENNSRLTRVVSIVPNPNNSNQLIITALDDIFIREYTGGKSIERYKEIEDYVNYYVPTKLNGFSLRPEHLPNNTNARMNEILKPISEGGVYNGLIDKDAVQYRYIVDTFNHGIENKSKAVYARLAKKRENIICLLNAPSWSEFKKSTNPSFRQAPTLEVKQFPVETRYIVSGGNLDRNPSVIYSLPDQKEGGIYTAFFGPNIILRDRAKDISVPPAMFVASNYTRKFIENNPWSIVAGTRRGALDIPNYVGVEQPLNEDDRALLENWGINPIIDKRNIGPMITSNSTAKQRIKSALSNIHVVDTLIYIQDGLSNILSNYVWEFNTPLVRREILDLVDQFLLSVLNGGGITAYLSTMDETNNTNEIIENNYGILDVQLEFVRGMGVIVHRTTIQRNGVISGGLL